MKNDLIDRNNVVPATMRALNSIMQEIFYGKQCEPKDAALRRYAKMLKNAIANIPSAGVNEIKVAIEDIGIVCGALAKAGYIVTTDSSGSITFAKEGGNADE